MQLCEQAFKLNFRLEPCQWKGVLWGSQEIICLNVAMQSAKPELFNLNLFGLQSWNEFEKVKNMHELNRKRIKL